MNGTDKCMIADATHTCDCLKYREIGELIDFESARERLQTEQLIAGGGMKRAEAFQATYDSIPSLVETPQSQEIVIINPEIKALIIGYAFIGACELMAHSSGQTVEFVRDGIIKRSMLNLKRDGLL